MTWTQFFSMRLAHIYLVYGLAFFVLGLAVALEIGRGEPNRFRRAMWPLAFFGLVHGTHEWVEMFSIVGRQTYNFQPSLAFEVARLLLLVVSFIALTCFGVGLLRPPNRLPRLEVWVSLGLLALYGLGVGLLGWWLNWQQTDWLKTADVLARYTLAIPGAVLTAWALAAQRQIFWRQHQSGFANDLLWMAVAFLLYGVVGQFFVGPSPLFPSNILNATTFQTWFGIPIQLFRAIMAGLAAIFTIRVLRAFELNRQQVLTLARQQVDEEISRRDALRQEFLHRIVETQEEERRRIARELHDELGQALTGLAIGLRGVQSSIDKPDLLRQQLSLLEEMATQALTDMRHLVNDLRPALLDDMGLPSALRHYVDNFSSLTHIKTGLTLCPTCNQLPDEVKTTLFRVTQESLTNIARHAHATQAWVNMNCDERQVTLQINDNGRGFDPIAILEGQQQMAWGLLGMQERVKLVHGEMDILSQAGQGATVTVRVPKPQEQQL